MSKKNIALDIQGHEIKVGDKVMDWVNNEIAKVIEVDENIVTIQYYNDEDYNGDIMHNTGDNFELLDDESAYELERSFEIQMDVTRDWSYR